MSILINIATTECLSVRGAIILVNGTDIETAIAATDIFIIKVRFTTSTFYIDHIYHENAFLYKV